MAETRFPLSHPLVSDRDGPGLQAAAGVLFVMFLIGAALQVLRMRAQGGDRKRLAKPVEQVAS